MDIGKTKDFLKKEAKKTDQTNRTEANKNLVCVRHYVWVHKVNNSN